MLDDICQNLMNGYMQSLLPALGSSEQDKQVFDLVNLIGKRLEHILG